MPTTKRFHIKYSLSSAATLHESFVKRTMVGEALGVDSGDTWELEYHSSDEIEDWSDPKQYVLTVDGHITHVSGSDTRERAKGSSSEVLSIRISEVRPETTEVVVAFHQEDLRECFGRLLAEMERFWPHVRTSATEAAPLVAQKNTRTRGPTVRTQMRAERFKALKDQHPEWSQAKVALEASHRPTEEGGLGEEVTGESVRNAYRAMGWEWERGDRVR